MALIRVVYGREAAMNIYGVWRELSSSCRFTLNTIQHPRCSGTICLGAAGMVRSQPDQWWTDAATQTDATPAAYSPPSSSADAASSTTGSNVDFFVDEVRASLLDILVRLDRIESRIGDRSAPVPAFADRVRSAQFGDAAHVFADSCILVPIVQYWYLYRFPP